MAEQNKKFINEDGHMEQRINVALIGIGQGGTKIAGAIAHRSKVDPKRIISVNMSVKDLAKANWVPEQNRIPLDLNGDGAGKDQEKSLVALQKSLVPTIRKIDTILDGDFDIAFVCFSADGGTGGGSGPMLTYLLNREEGNTEFPAIKKRNGTTPVIGIVAIPELSDDNESSMVNAQNCLNNIRGLISKPESQIPFMIIDNGADSYSGETEEQKFANINNDVAFLIDRFINVEFDSTKANLDMADRFATLSNSKIIGLTNGGKSSPFVLPVNCAVRDIAFEVSEDDPLLPERFSKQIGAAVTNQRKGYYEAGTPNATPIIAYAGFNPLERIAVPYENKVKSIEAKIASRSKEDNEKGEGFANLAFNKDAQKSGQVKAEANPNDIFAQMLG